MSKTLTTNANPYAAVNYGNTNLNATADTNIRGGATTVYVVTIDNTANVAKSYLQMFNNAAPTVGTTPPDAVLMVDVGVKRTFFLDFLGMPFATALSMACTTTPTGNTNPGSAVTVFALLS